jgi:hypothetical protein
VDLVDLELLELLGHLAVLVDLELLELLGHLVDLELLELLGHLAVLVDLELLGHLVDLELLELLSDLVLPEPHLFLRNQNNLMLHVHLELPGRLSDLVLRVLM